MTDIEEIYKQIFEDFKKFKTATDYLDELERELTNQPKEEGKCG